MRILVWSQHFWPENFRINEVVQELCRRGNEVTVLTGKPNYPEGHIFPGYKAWGIDHETHSGAEIIRIPHLPRRNGSAFNLTLNYLSFIIAAYIIAPFSLINRKYDVVFVYGTSPILQALPAVFITWVKKTKLVIWVQDLWPDSIEATGFIKNKLLLNIIGKIVKYIYRNANSILIQSEAFRSSIEPFVSDKSTVIYLPNPSDDFWESKPSTEKASEIALDMSKHFSLVFAGNIGHAQSVETIVSAANLLRTNTDIKFYLVGSGNNVKAISEMISTQQLQNVVMIDRLPYSDMNTIFEASSGLILSLKDNNALSKTIPSKLQGYLSAGKPIIGSLNGAGEKLISDAKAGFSSPAEDPISLADQIKKLYALPPKEREKLGKNGRHYYESHCSLAIVTERLLKCLNNE